MISRDRINHFRRSTNDDLQTEKKNVDFFAGKRGNDCEAFLWNAAACG
jgi:hypothetical protein